jgi:hypothetical protein
MVAIRSAQGEIAKYLIGRGADCRHTAANVCAACIRIFYVAQSDEISCFESSGNHLLDNGIRKWRA